MNESMEQVMQLFEAFAGVDNEMRRRAEEQYYVIESEHPKELLQILFQVATSNQTPRNVQFALTLISRFILGPKAIQECISRDDAFAIRTFFLEILQNTQLSNVEHALIFNLADIYATNYTDDTFWGDIPQYLPSLFQSKPLVALKLSTQLFEINPIPPLSQMIVTFLQVAPPDVNFLSQAIVSQFVLIQNQIIASEEFIPNLVPALNSLPDELLIQPMNAFLRAFLIDHLPYLPIMPQLFQYLLTMVGDLSKNEMMRIQFLHIFCRLVNESQVFRQFLIKNPDPFIIALANTVANPHKDDQLYIEAKTDFDLVDSALLNERDAIQPAINAMLTNDNPYVQSFFMRASQTNDMIPYAYNNVFNDDVIIRENCIEIFLKWVNYRLDNSSGVVPMNIIIRPIHQEVVTVIYKYIESGFFDEIYPLITQWFIDDDHLLQHCIPLLIHLISTIQFPPITLMLIASHIIARCPTTDELSQLALLLLNKAVSSFGGEYEFLDCVTIFGNVFSLIDLQNQCACIELIMPILVADKLLLALPSCREMLVEMCDNLEQFEPVLDTFIEGMIEYIPKFNEYLRPLPLTTLEDDRFTCIRLKDNTVIGTEATNSKTLFEFLYTAETVIHYFPEYVNSRPQFCKHVYQWLDMYIDYPIDTNVQTECLQLLIEYGTTVQIDRELFITLADLVSRAVQIATDAEVLLLSTNATRLILRHLPPEDAQIPYNIIPIIIKSLIALLSASESDQYLDSMTEHFIYDAFKNILSFFVDSYGINPHISIALFNEVCRKYPYFNIDNIDKLLTCFLMSLWTNFVLLTPSELLPNYPPDVLSDLFELFKTSPHIIVQKTCLKCITKFASQKADEVMSFLKFFEKVTQCDKIEVNIRVMALCKFTFLLAAISQENFELQYPFIFEMSQLAKTTERNMEKLMKNLLRLAIKISEFGYETQYIKYVHHFIISEVSSGFFTKISHIVKTLCDVIGDNPALQTLQQNLLELLKEEENEDNEEN